MSTGIVMTAVPPTMAMRMAITTNVYGRRRARRTIHMVVLYPKARSILLNDSQKGGVSMPKYLVQGSYTAEGAKGLRKDGGSKRRQVAEALLKEAGGKLDAFYFTFGETDFAIIADLPDNG